MNRPLPLRQTAFRLDENLLARLDAHARRMEHQHPGVTFARADALRELLGMALGRVEAAEARKKAR